MTEALARLDLGALVLQYGTTFLRVLGLFLFLPIFGSELLPLKLRVGVAAAVTVVMLPLAPAAALAPGDTVGWGVLAVRELSVGLVLGIGARAIFAGVEGAAAMIATQSGFALASMVDPMSGDQALTPVLFQNLLTVAVFLAADLHHVFIAALVSSYELLPPAAALPATAGFDQVAGVFGARLFGVAVQFAAPALVITVSVDLVLALVGRAMPQVPILLVGYPFKLAVGLFAMALLAVSTGTAMGWIGRALTADARVVLDALGGS